jgi:D-beta-D-heptose 7-phosphate kinase/D-beta-D-heptose 1-phosphate adenosyltransferase
MSIDAAAEYRAQLRVAGKTVVFTNGLFDLLHIGHLSYLERARTLGDILIVGLNSDESSRSLKGESHPIQPQEERAQLLAALNVVDVVVIFNEQTASQLIRALKPDIYVKGGDYARKTWPEREIALAMGCEVKLIPFLKGHSTTRLVEKIVSRFGSNGSAT